MIARVRLTTIGVAIAIGMVALPSPASAQEKCSGEPTLTILTPLHFGGIWVRAGGGGAVIVSVRGDVSSVGDVMIDGRGEAGRLSICGEAGSTVELLLQPRAPDRTAASPLNRVRDLELFAAGAILERQSEGAWLVTLGPRGRLEVSIGGTLIIPRSADAVHRVFEQAYLVSVARAKGRR